MNLPKFCQSRDGSETGRVVGWRACTLEGCRGARIGVRWPSGRLTWPCLKGCDSVNAETVRIA